jgi:prepilin-type N-terminal cleavage/methylation domain-containing protein
MKKNNGLSLIELIVSIMVFSIVMVGVIVFNTRNTKIVIRSERNAQRVLLQERVLEEFKGELRSAATSGAGFDSLWINANVGDSLYALTFDTAGTGEGIAVRLEVKEFVPDKSAPIAQSGNHLKINLICIDSDLGISDTIETIISRHD